MQKKDHSKTVPFKWDCLTCPHYDYVDEEVGYQCAYSFNPPCDEPEGNSLEK